MAKQEKPKFKFPSEIVELPSKGLLYPEGHPLSSGTVEMKYMTAKEEDILTNMNYVKQGVVIDKLLQSLLVTEFDYDDLLIGDKNAIMIAARVLGYGKEYPFTHNGQEIVVDLTQLPEIVLDENEVTKGVNEFDYENIKDEIGDVQIYLTMIADEFMLDPIECAKEKMKKNIEKYPIKC